MVPLKFKKNVSLDFFIRYSDGSSYEAQGLKLAKATAKGSVIDLTKSRVTLKVKNKTVASTKFARAENDDDEDEGTVTGIRLNKTSATLAEGSTMSLTATISPDGANKEVRWTSSDSSVATVSSGKVTGKKAGTATIIATTVDGGYTASCKVTVSAKKVPVTGITLNQTSLSLSVGDTSSLTATVNPSGASKKTVRWKSTSTSIATVSSSGKVTGKKAGTATIIVTTVDGGYTASCKVTVTAKTISNTINFHNHMGKQISELYFVESGDSSWGEEYLSTHHYAKLDHKHYIQVPLKFTTDASLAFYIRCSDGSEYEARGLSLAKAGTTGAKIELTESKVNLLVNNAAAASATFVQKKASTDEMTKLSDADWAALQNAYKAMNMAYTYVANAYNDDQIKANKEIEDAMKSAQDLIMEMGMIKREGLSVADGKKLLEAMELTAKALQDILDAMETVPQTRTINVKFINGTTADFTNFSAKPEGGTGNNPETLKSGGETTLEFTVADTASAFEITFTESLNNQPYTMTVTFDSSVKDGDTLTVQFNVNEQT